MSRHLLVDLFASLDGFAAGADGGQDFAYPFIGPEIGGFIHEVLDAPHTIVMGRRTYDALGAFWPSSDAPQAAAMNSKQKLVFSRTLSGPLAWNNARLAERDLATEIGDLKSQEGPPLRAIGSLELGRELLSLGLIDAIRLVVFPVALGLEGSKPIFGGCPPTAMQLRRSRTFDDATLVLEYEPRSSATSAQA